MLTTYQALIKGFKPSYTTVETDRTYSLPELMSKPTWSYKFGKNNEYELCFEPLIWDNQMYVALYRNEELLTERVVVKPGHIKDE